jgi:hypothetical protein
MSDPSLLPCQLKRLGEVGALESRGVVAFPNMPIPLGVDLQVEPALLVEDVREPWIVAPVRLHDGSVNHEAHKGELTKLSRKAAEAILDDPIDKLTNIRMHLIQDGREVSGSLYAKVIDAVAGSGNSFYLRFTSVSPFFQAQTSAAANSMMPAAP